MASTSTAYSAPSALSIQEAQQADYIAFLHRHPFARDAHALGFLTGVREDYQLQDDGFRNVDIPVGMLDNDFRDPDLDRYVSRFRKYQPQVAVLGDAMSEREAQEYLGVAKTLLSEFPDVTIIVVPKCHSALSVLKDTAVTLGFPMGYSDQQADDFSDPVHWRGQDVHLLGGSPPKQYAQIQKLTQPTVTGDPPANIVGADWNGPAKICYKGEYWSRNGWRSADHLSIRETVRKSLEEIRAFWKEREVWPNTTPREQRGPAVSIPDDVVWAADGSHIDDRETLEDAIVVEYEDGRTYGYRDAHERKRIEYYEGRLGNAVRTTA